jgi:hypothetical protein
MVMIAAGGDKRGLAAEPLHQFEAKHAAIEVECAIDVGDLQMHAADAHARIDRWIRGRWR